MSCDNFKKRPKKEISVLTNLVGEGIKAFYKEPLIKEKQVNIRFYGV
jgi:undecaprenyl pyrophosphate synthase